MNSNKGGKKIENLGVGAVQGRGQVLSHMYQGRKLVTQISISGTQKEKVEGE